MSTGAQKHGDYLASIFGLSGRRAVVTGGTSGLGASSAVALARAGAEVVISGRDAARGEAVAERIARLGGHGVVELCDVGEPAAIREFAERVEREHGPVDILVNSAGIYIAGDAVSAPLQDFELTWQVNVTGLMVMCQEFGRRMIGRGDGKIVNLASISALRATKGGATYAASKGAVVQLTRVMALEWIRSGVNVNCIAPSDFETPMDAELLADPAYLEHLERRNPSGRAGQPAELDGAVLYLASPASDFVVGQTLIVDGGTMIA
jgi:gluconate 5-dehydrogenase